MKIEQALIKRLFRGVTYGSFFWHKRVFARSGGEELRGWTIISNTQVSFFAYAIFDFIQGNLTDIECINLRDLAAS